MIDSDSDVLRYILADNDYFKLRDNRTHYITLLAIYNRYTADIWSYTMLKDIFTPKQFAYAYRYLIKNRYIVKVDPYKYRITNKGIEFCRSYISYLKTH